jgi:hypothetical protein
VRLACIWDKKPDVLVAIYGFQKKTQKWPKNELNNMRNEKKAYYESKVKLLSGGKNGRPGKVMEYERINVSQTTTKHDDLIVYEEKIERFKAFVCSNRYPEFYYNG